MKKLLPFLAIFLSLSSLHAQTWETVKLDSSISVSLPKDYQKKDTLGQQITTANAVNGYIIISKAPDNEATMPDIDKEKHLLKYYDKYIQEIKSSSKGRITNEKDTLLGKLKVKDFTLEEETPQGINIRNFRIIHENCATYTFQFLYEKVHEEVSAEECAKFYKSIAVANNPVLASQFTTETTATNQKTSMLPYIAGIIILVILIVVIIIMRKRRKA